MSSGITIRPQSSGGQRSYDDGEERVSDERVATPQQETRMFASNMQWILSGLMMFIGSPLFFSLYLYAATKITSVYFEYAFSIEFGTTLSFHDRVYICIMCFVLNFIAHQFTGFMMKSIERYATYVVQESTSYRPVDYTNVTFSAQWALSLDFYGLSAAVWNWIRSNLSPLKWISNFTWSTQATCLRFHSMLYWITSVTFVVLLCRSVYGVHYKFFPDMDSQVFGPVYNLLTSVFDPGGILTRTLAGGYDFNNYAKAWN